MRKLLSRLILWALTENYDWWAVPEEITVLMKERGLFYEWKRAQECTWGAHQAIHDDISKRLAELKDSLGTAIACISGTALKADFLLLSEQIEEMRAKLAEQPAEPTPTIRRAANHGEFRIAAEAAVRKRK